MPPRKDFSRVAPRNILEKASIRMALAHTLDEFFSYTSSYPVAPIDEWASYADQYSAIQHEFVLVWKSMYPHKPMPTLFGFAEWSGGVTRWPRIKQAEDIIDAYARPNKAPLVTKAEQQRAARRLWMGLQPKDVSNTDIPGCPAKPEDSSLQPLSTPKKSGPAFPMSKINYVLSENPKDGRGKTPNINNEVEMISLDRALSHSRMAFNHYIGQWPRPTDKTACYTTQFHQMYVEFQDMWRQTHGPESMPPKLFCLPEWEGAIMDWKAPVEDEEYMKPFLYALNRSP